MQYWERANAALNRTDAQSEEVVVDGGFAYPSITQVFFALSIVPSLYFHPPAACSRFQQSVCPDDAIIRALSSCPAEHYQSFDRTITQGKGGLEAFSEEPQVRVLGVFPSCPYSQSCCRLAMLENP